MSKEKDDKEQVILEELRRIRFSLRILTVVVVLCGAGVLALLIPNKTAVWVVVIVGGPAIIVFCLIMLLNDAVRREPARGRPITGKTIVISEQADATDSEADDDP